MAIFEDIDINFQLDTISVEEVADRWFGVEPYVIPIFFKIDGERYSAFLRIFNTQPADEGTTEVTETTPIQLDLESTPEDRPHIFIPRGSILRADAVDMEAGEELDVSDVQFETTLRPIPLVIDVLGLFTLEGILNGPIFTELLNTSKMEVLNLAFEGASGFLAAALGLDEALDACPRLTSPKGLSTPLKPSSGA